MHSVHWLYLVEKLKVPTSLHLIFIFISSIQKPIYIHAVFHTGILFHSFSLYLYLLLSFPSSLSVYLSFLRSVFHVTALAGVAEGELMASLSGVLAAVLPRLLGSHTGSTSWASMVVGHSSSSDFSSSFF